MAAAQRLLKDEKRFSGSGGRRGNSKPDRLQRMPLIVLLLGKSGLGVSTFADMMTARATDKNVTYYCVQENGVETKCTPTEADSSLASFLFYREISGELEHAGGRIKVSVLDVRGLEEDTTRQFNHFDTIVAMLKRRMSRYLEQSDIEYMVRAGKVDESRGDRRRAADNRVHACLYFLEPLKAALPPRDVDNLQKLQGIVNVIPVIGRADMLTGPEIALFKQGVKRDLAHHAISLYLNSLPPTPPKDAEDIQLFELIQATSEKSPFAVVSSTEIVSLPSGPKLGRKHGWGVVSAQEHSDVQALHELLLSLNEDLRVRTLEVLYDSFRAERLAKMKPVKAET